MPKSLAKHIYRGRLTPLCLRVWVQYLHIAVSSSLALKSSPTEYRKSLIFFLSASCSRGTLRDRKKLSSFMPSASRAFIGWSLQLLTMEFTNCSGRLTHPLDRRPSWCLGLNCPVSSAWSVDSFKVTAGLLLGPVLNARWKQNRLFSLLYLEH